MFAGTNLYSQTFCYDMPGGEPGVVACHIPLIPLLQGQIAVICIARPCIKTTTTAATMGAGHGNHHFLYMYIKYQRTHSCMYERTCIHIYTQAYVTLDHRCASLYIFIYVYLVIQYIHVLCVYVICVNAPLYIKCMNQNMDLDPKGYFYYTSHPCKA